MEGLLCSGVLGDNSPAWLVGISLLEVSSKGCRLEPTFEAFPYVSANGVGLSGLNKDVFNSNWPFGSLRED